MSKPSVSLNEQSVPGEECISDDSSFYGDEEQQDALMDHAAAFSASKFFSSPKPTSRLLRPFYNADSVVVPTRKPFNPFEEAAYHARQLNETVAAFVARLPPSTTSTEAVGGWIWIANPHAALRETDADVSGVREEGGKILGRLRAKLDEIEVTMSTKGQAARTRAQNKARAESQGALLAMAKKRSVRTGKWMLFPSKADVDRVWRAVAEGTAEGRLGCSAKVAADEGAGERAERVVCVYTEDFSDIDDVKRVLMELATLGQVQSCGPMGQTRGIYFKPDVFTHLDIGSTNKYGLKASLYASRDLIK